MKKVYWINPLIVTVILLFLTTDCKKEKFTSLPVLGTISMNSVADTYAESKSKINSDGGATVSVRGVCWNLTSEPTTADSKTTDDNPGTGTFMSKITGLTPGTTYHLRAYATNEVGTSYSDEITFSTKSTLPTLTTAAVTAIAASTATSGGNITSDGGAAIITRGVCWGTTTNPTTSNLKTTDGTGTGAFISNLTGLTAGTLYHLRAYATNSLGTSYGSDITFSTSAVLPVLTTSPLTAITAATAAGGGNITSDGGAAITARGVCWSTTANPVTSDSKTIDGTGAGQFVSSISGLTAGTTYHLRSYATNSAGTAYGADILFVTLGQTPASVSQQATNLTITGATLNGMVNPNYLSTTVTFEYGLTTAYGQTIAAIQSPVAGNSITNVSADISGLTQGTTYHFRVKTVNTLGTVYSGDMSFVTPNFATLNTIIISSITSNSAASGGNIITDGGAPVNARGVCWNTTGNPTVADNKTADGSGTGSFVSQLTGLLPVTTYFVRSYATNTYGTSYGNQITFMTLATPPTLNTDPILGITTSTATGGGSITSDGGASITARGVCWSTSPDPSTALSTKTNDGSGTGIFTSNITGLTAGTTYHVRAYATNSVGTTYGADITFTTISAIPINGLVGYWPFNGNANDESGNGHNGTVNGPILITDRFGINNRAYSFDGSNDYIAIAPSSLVDNETTVTLSFWIKRDALDNYGLPIHTGNQGRIQTSVSKDSVSVGVTTNSNYDGSAPSEFGVTYFINQTQWNNVVLRYDGTRLGIYINGEFKKETYAEGNIWAAQSSYLAFGVYYLFGTPHHGYYKGLLDDVSLYKRALDTNEIQALYHEGGW